MGDTNVVNWTEKDVQQWAKREQIDDTILKRCIIGEGLDGKCMLALNESDVRDLCERHNLRMGHSKHFWIATRLLQRENHTSLVNLGLVENHHQHHQQNVAIGGFHHQSHMHHHHHHCSGCSDITMHDMERISPPLSIDGRASSIQPEVFKAMISLGKLTLLMLASILWMHDNLPYATVCMFVLFRCDSVRVHHMYIPLARIATVNIYFCETTSSGFY